MSYPKRGQIHCQTAEDTPCCLEGRRIIAPRFNLIGVVRERELTGKQLESRG